MSLEVHIDDHLRNHGFLMHDPGRWSLSPAYDVNPVPEMDRVRTSKTPITEDQQEPTIAVRSPQRHDSVLARPSR